MNFEFVSMELVLTIVGCAVVTALPRVLPLMYLSVESLPKASLQWLSYVPVAVMAALLFPDVLTRADDAGHTVLFLSHENTYLLAAIPSLLLAWYTKSFFGTIACAMGMVGILRYCGWLY